MNTARSILFLLTTTIMGCNGLDFSENTPDCLKPAIRDFKKGDSCKDAGVDEYIFQGRTVFVLGVGGCCCDRVSEVLDIDCNSLGFLGGISGNTSINGERFSNATFIHTIWKN